METTVAEKSAEVSQGSVVLFHGISANKKIMSYLARGFAEQNHGTAFGAMFTIGATGSLLLPPLIGSYARRTSIRQAMRIPVVVALVLAGVLLFLGLARPIFSV